MSGSALVDDGVGEMRELSDKQFSDEWMGYFGFVEGIKIMGWCLWMSAQGARSFNDVRLVVAGRKGNRGLSRRESYRNLLALRKFREHYAAIEGRELVDDDDGVIAKIVGSMYQVAA